MRLRFALIAIACLSAAPAFAIDTYDCGDAKGQVTLEFDVDSSDQPFKRVQMQITDDIGISTDPAHEDFDGEYLGSQFAGQDFQGVDVAWKDDSGSIHKAMSLRLVSAYEGDAMVIAGALSVDGGGAWALTCKARILR